MQMKETVKHGKPALTLSVTAFDDEPLVMLFKDFKPTIMEWCRRNGEQRGALDIAVVTQPVRIETLHRSILVYCESDPELVTLLTTRLSEATLTFLTPDGRLLGRFNSVPQGEPAAAGELKPATNLADGSQLRVAIGPVIVERKVLARVVARFVGTQFKTMWVEGWTGRHWSSYAPGLPAVEACMAAPPAPGAFLQARKVAVWPEGYVPKVGPAPAAIAATKAAGPAVSV